MTDWWFDESHPVGPPESRIFSDSLSKALISVGRAFAKLSGYNALYLHLENWTHDSAGTHDYTGNLVLSGKGLRVPKVNPLERFMPDKNRHYPTSDYPTFQFNFRPKSASQPRRRYRYRR